MHDWPDPAAIVAIAAIMNCTCQKIAMEPIQNRYNHWWKIVCAIFGDRVPLVTQQSRQS